MTQATCQTCLHRGEPSKKTKGLFACRRHPPTVHIVVESRDFRKDHYKGIAVWSEQQGDVSIWPTIRPTDWCGEHTPASKAQAAEVGL